MKKIILSVLLCGSLVLTLAGCGGGCARQEKTAAAGRDGDGFGSGVSDLGCRAFGDA